MKDDDLHLEALEAFKCAAEAEQENRADALDDLNFAVKEEQWPDEIRRQRERDGRPCLTRNLLGPFIRQVVNDGRQNRPSLRAQPVDDDADPHTAELINGLFRNIENISSADIAYDTALEFAVSAGFGYIKVNTEFACDDRFDKDVIIETVANPFSIYGDPFSDSVDGSDWNSAFEVELLPQTQFEDLYKKADPVDWDELGYGTGLSPDWQDGSGDQRRLLVANWWRREKVMNTILLLQSGDVVTADDFKLHADMFAALGAQVEGERQVPSYRVTVTKLSGAEVLEKPKPWVGRYIPIVPVYGHVININGVRRITSLIRSAKDAQKSYNFHHTVAAELTGYAPKAPFIGPRGAFKTDRLKWETANSQSWAYIEYDLVPGMAAPPQRQAFAGVPAGEVAAAQQAQADMRSIIGMFEASFGQNGNETSGKAILARQREGDTATFHHIDNLTRALRQVGRICLDVIPSVYLPDRVARIMGPDGSSRTVTLGQPTPLTNAMGEVQKNPDGSARLHIYDLTKGKYDLVVSAGPGFTTKREEAASQMVELIRAYPMAAPVIGDLLAKNLDWPGADEIAQRLKAMMPEQAKGGDGPETVQLKQNLESATNELTALKRTIETMQADRDIKRRELKNDEKETEIKAYEAETRRMAAAIGKDGVGLSKDDVAQMVLATISQILDDPDLIHGDGPAPAAQPLTPQAVAPVAVPPVEAPPPPMPPQAPQGAPEPPMAPPGA